MILLGLTALAARATRRPTRSYCSSDAIRPQPGGPACVVIRSHYIPGGTRRPTGRRRRAQSPAGR
ncbi:hypothetical protein JOF56_006056 [Kibdelosporangium banguiense]|uniref:Uncharacterized protein n=1 Tax=Kibdelosporangium banguiense TaxID=1365924 RepID=A0ABS4TMN2_9PSEU|nr:hypothetical protein [Kibdelosporangium banguiense]MBP2325671.1 hypothetical protein [Kibdelosporangium banguiense]